MKIRTVDLSQADIRCRVELDLRDGLLQAARQDRTSLSEWVRRILRQGVAERLAAPSPLDQAQASTVPATRERIAA